jgi:hypothetical protein
MATWNQYYGKRRWTARELAATIIINVTGKFC